jgi:hypothetical protein
MIRWALFPAAILLAAGTARAAELFPFVLPWDDATPGVTDLSGWLPRPAGDAGPVHAGDDGHLYAGDRRVRFLGVNVCFEACFPTHDDADKIAARMARFGINVVRFHHMDMMPAPAGIRARKGEGTGELDADALDRLDYFVARLKEHGVYANLNLLVSRPFARGDGLPAEIEKIDPKDRHVVGFFYEPILALQKEYARKLLAHKNPYTRLTYAEDPAVAFVEINNENGLIHGWLGGAVDRMPEVFLRDLQGQWNAWLRNRYRSTEKLRQAWGVKDEPPGKELLANTDFAKGTDGWVLERHDKAEATLSADDSLPDALRTATPKPRSAHVTVKRAGAEGWHVQLTQPGLKVEAGRPYTLSFWARADQALRLTADVGQAHDPWGNLGLGRGAALTKDWQSFRFTFLAGASDDNARVNFTGLGAQTGELWLAGVSFRPGGTVGLAAGQGLEDRTVPWVSHERLSEWPAEAQRDWLRFLWQTEDDYWQAMRRFLKDELKVKGVVVGTIVGCSTPNLMARLDAVDTHAYWQHPQFPHRQWDPEDWVVPNKTMVNEAGGTLPGLALRRVQGQPHLVSEYNHPAPNTYGQEGFLLLAAYAALQDWDAVYVFAYAHTADWDARRITSFFDISQHPTKMVTLPAAAALFVRGDVKPAAEQVVVGLDREREVDLLRTGRPWELVHAGHVGVPPEVALVHRVGIAVEGGKPPKPAEVPRPAGPRYVSDTKELTWDLTTKDRGVVTVDVARSKAVIGYGGGKRFDLGGVLVEPGETAQDGWSVVTLTAMEGDFKGPGRLLVTATGTAENTGMKWKDAAKDSVGKDWGKAPSLVEGVPVRLTLPAAAERVRAWPLDERGRRRDALVVEKGKDGAAVLALDHTSRTLWYEVEVAGK